MVYLSTRNGLLKWDVDHWQDWKDHPYLGLRITDIEIQGENLLLGTRGHGLLVKTEDTVYVVGENEGLPSSIISAIDTDVDGVLWIGTNVGLCRLELDGHQIQSAVIFDQRHGLASNAVRDVLCNGDQVYCATAQGVSILNRHQLPEYGPLPLYLVSCTANDQKVDLSQAVNLPYDRNRLQIEYLGISFETADKLKYRYKLDGGEGGWQYTTARTVDYNELPPGEYRFLVAVADPLGHWGKEQTLAFIIEAPWWQTWTFRVLAVIFIILILLLLYRQIIRQTRRRSAVDAQIERLKLQALRAQMNPHFVFNVLATIQAYVGQEDVLKAQTYIARFAELIRAMLNHSMQAWVPIRDEVKLLRLYLELEQMRFGDALTYKLSVDPEIDQASTRLPAMLIQPFIENAIVHGLAQKQEEGLVSLHITKRGDQLCCVIEDNGMGRKKASERRKQHRPLHQSVGVTITRERLKLVSKRKLGAARVSYTDLTDDEGNVAGTQVELLIPYRTDQIETYHDHESTAG